MVHPVNMPYANNLKTCALGTGLFKSILFTSNFTPAFLYLTITKSYYWPSSVIYFGIYFSFRYKGP